MSKLLERVTRDSNAEIDALIARVDGLERDLTGLHVVVSRLAEVAATGDQVSRVANEICENIGVLQTAFEGSVGAINQQTAIVRVEIGRTQNAVLSALEEIAPRKVVNEFTENIKRESIK